MRKAHLRARGPFLPPLDQITQYPFEPGYVTFTLPCPKRIRVKANGQFVADSTRVLILFESDHIPIYYFPLEDIQMNLFEPGERRTQSPFKGVAKHYSLKDADGRYDDILWQYADPVPGSCDLSQYGSFYWHEVDQWFEEDEQVFVHVRDPFRRVDCLPSSRLVSVEHERTVVAASARGVFLFETGLPTRHYLPIEDVRREYLEPSNTRTQCPYKGEAHYYHLQIRDKVIKDAVWYYPEPVHEAARIRGLLCFAAEFVTRITVDGEDIGKPQTALVHGYNYHGYKE